MANDLNTNPLVIDTAIAGSAAIGRSLRVSQIVWMVGATPGTLTIEDSAGNVLATLLGTASTEVSQSFAQPRRWRGDFKIPTIPSGTVYVFLV